MVWNLLRQLREYPDLDTSVILLNEGRLAEKLRGLGLSVQVFDEHRQSFPKLIRSARGLVLDQRIQVIHSHRYKENILAYFAGLFHRNIRLIATQHGLREAGLIRKGTGGKIVAGLNTYLLAHQFDRVIAVSNNIRDYFLYDCRAPQERICVINNGIELPAPCVREPRPVTVAGSAGRFFPVKDYPLLVAVAQEVVASESSVRFELAGDGPQRSQLEKLITNAGLDEAFLFRGEVLEMSAFYQGLDIYLNTSLHEGIPLSVLEAMAYGLPVVAPAVGGLREIITDGVEGFLVDSRDPRRYAEICLLLLRDRELRKRIGYAAREKVARCFSAEKMAQHYFHLYHDLADVS